MRTIRHFIKLESTSGIVLFIMMLAALLLSNSPWQAYYQTFIHLPFSLHCSSHSLTKTLTEWVNEGFMALFFLLIGLEIKQEMLQGALSNIKSVLLPGVAALGGILAPALIYFLFNYHDKTASMGWAIPTATDTAFALGLLTLFGKKINSSFKIFVMSLAILDDVLAILIITLFYNNHLSYPLILLALVCTFMLIFINFFGIKRLIFYWIIGGFVWLFLLESGVHAIIAGIILAFTIPFSVKSKPHFSPLKNLQRALHPWVAYGVLPFFIFINAGLYLHDLSLISFLHPVSLGIIFGLVIGKPIGIFIACWLAVKLGIAQLIHRMTWFDIWSAAMLCGIGFTVSLFIGDLAFANNENLLNLVKLGVLVGSTLSGCLSYILLSWHYANAVK